MLNILRRVLGPLLQIVLAIIDRLRDAKTSVQPPLDGQVDQPPVLPEAPQTQTDAPQGESSHTVGGDPNRQGTFILTDVYSLNFDKRSTPHRDLPPYEHLKGLRFGENGKLEVVGAIIKASQSTGWGAVNEEWFRQSWRRLKEVGGDRYGVDFFRGAYHFLQLNVDGAKQADYYLKLVEQAGGWDVGDIMPIVDLEEGGQGTWAGGEKLAMIKDPVRRARLRDAAIACTTKFVKRVKEVTGHRVMLYGRGMMRDLGIKDRMSCDAVWNPAWTVTMPPMDAYGWPLQDIPLWQLNGGGTVAAKGFPSEIPGWGKMDYSVYIDGTNKTDLVSFRRRLLCRPR